jgi:predicted transposase/invertase (TIGR01784 family)
VFFEKEMEEGREEALLHTAKKFLAKGISVDDVSEATGLSIDHVRALLDS